MLNTYIYHSLPFKRFGVRFMFYVEICKRLQFWTGKNMNFF
jgi:hypothetical protein